MQRKVIQCHVPLLLLVLVLVALISICRISFFSRSPIAPNVHVDSLLFAAGPLSVFTLCFRRLTIAVLIWFFFNTHSCRPSVVPTISGGFFSMNAVSSGVKRRLIYSIALLNSAFLCLLISLGSKEYDSWYSNNSGISSSRPREVFIIYEGPPPPLSCSYHIARSVVLLSAWKTSSFDCKNSLKYTKAWLFQVIVAGRVPPLPILW